MEISSRIQLNNGVEMPIFGLGVYQMTNEEAEQAVCDAIEMGYRSIDTAAIYDNEEGVGLGIKQVLDANIVEREDLFITSKVWNEETNFEDVKEAFHETLRKLQLDYLDLYLIHWPGIDDNYKEVWRALEELHEEGLVKAIGVCNFTLENLEDLLEDAEIVPAINQVECHPCLRQDELKEYCQAQGIILEAWSPLMQGGLLENEYLQEIAKRHSKTPAQVILRWHLQNGTVIIPKSTHKERLEENSNIFDFNLAEAEMGMINSLNIDTRIGPNPENFDFGK